MIPKEQETRIIDTIRTMASGNHKEHEQIAEQQRLMLVGAIIALGDEAPPIWLINTSCGRTDRIFGN